MKWRESLRNRLGQFQFSFFPLFRRVVAVTTALFIIAGVTFFSLVSTSQPTLAEVAVLDIETGIVKVRAANEIFFTSVDSGKSIYVGDTVRVAKNSAATLSFADTGAMRLSADTEMTITEADSTNQLSTENPVRVSLLTGSVETNVDKVNNIAFEIKTSAGVIEANQAKLAVTVSDSGTTEVITSDDTVALRSSDGSSTAQLVAGQRAILASTNVVVNNLPVSELGGVQLGPKQLLTKVDILKIHFFDALILAENGKVPAAKIATQAIYDQLADLVANVGAGSTPMRQAEALKIWLADQHAGAVELPRLLADLTVIDQLEVLISHYFITPKLKRGVPEFELVASSRYRPTLELRKLFAVLRARNLAAESIQPVVAELLASVTAEYTEELARRDSRKWTKKFLVGMGDQPIFLKTLQELRVAVPASARYLVDKKLIELTRVLEAYKGNTSREGEVVRAGQAD